MNGGRLPVEVDRLVDLECRTLMPEVYFDPDLYELELRRIFARAWLYVAHDSQIARTGDFVTTTMGQDPVIACRDGAGRVRVYVNSCRHRGTRICRVDEGNAAAFRCPYHGWTYNIEGKLTGVPNRKAAHGERLNPEEWGLIEAARVESFRGLWFATFDETSPSLADHLGDMSWYLDLVLNRSVRGTAVLPGVNRWRVRANWKLPAEQFMGDFAHSANVHQSMAKLGFDQGFGHDSRDFIAHFEQGHAWLNLAPRVETVASPHEQAMCEQARAALSPAQARLLGCLHVATVFPNFSIVGYPGFVSLRVWQPRGPLAVEIHSWCLVEEDAPAGARAQARDMQTRLFSPSGILEQDDVAVWEEVMLGLGALARRGFALNLQAGSGTSARMDDLPGQVGSLFSEESLMAFYRRWLQMMGRP